LHGLNASKATAKERILELQEKSRQLGLIKLLRHGRIVKGNRKERQFQKTMCALNINQIVLFFARSGDAISVAAKECAAEMLAGQPDLSDQKKTCASNVLGIIEALSYGGNSIANAVANCPKPAEADAAAACGAKIVNVVASLSGIAASATNMRQSCTLPGGPNPEIQEHGVGTAATLGAEGAQPEDQ